MQSKLIEFWVGLFVIIGLLALSMLAFKVGNFSGAGQQNNYSIVANFENIGGLTEKSPVRMAGVNIGRVQRIELDDDDYSAKVTMLIEAQYNNLPFDTSAAILTSGLIGSNYIGLEAGGDIDFLKNGDILEITQSAIVLENLIGKFLFNNANSSDGGSK